MIFAGLDGCPEGWVAAVIDGKHQRLSFLEQFEDIATMHLDRATVDMPIGLPDRGYRACDLSARLLLDKSRSRVFLGAQRCVIDYRFQSASLVNEYLHARGDPGISLQLWHLRAKLREADTFVRRNPAIDVRETHPELVFWRLNGKQPVPSKKSKDGVAQRRELLRTNGFPDIDELLIQPRKLKAKPDDILDSCAGAIAARDFDVTRALPAGRVPRDPHGLPMQIWY